MRGYVIKKVALALLTLFLVLTFDFVLFRLLPDDPLDVLSRFSGATEPDKVAELTQTYALDEPVFPNQYVVFLKQMVTLDLGEEFSRGLPAWSLIWRFAPPTFLLVGSATVLAAVIGISIGMLGGWRRAGPVDRGATGFSVVMFCIPPFVLATVLVTIFAGVLQWFPASGARSITDVTGSAWLLDRWNHLFLPLIALTLTALAPFYLVMRESMVDVLGEDYLTLARAKGVDDRSVRKQARGPQRVAADQHPARVQHGRDPVGLDRGGVRVRLSGARLADRDGDEDPQLPGAARRVPAVRGDGDRLQPRRRHHVRVVGPPCAKSVTAG